MSSDRHVVDSHCHLDCFDEVDRALVLENAVKAGVTEIVTIGTRLSEAGRVVSIARSGAPGATIWCSVGTHPEHVSEQAIDDPAAIARLTLDPHVVAVGETGLDYMSPAVDREQQRASFRAHVAAGRIADLPVIIHSRGADEDMAAILREESGQGPFRFVLHCFASSEMLAVTGLELGGYISFSGILTFQKSDELRRIALSIPLDRVLVETDAPYLSPVPKRGRRNEPAHVVHVVDVLAKLTQTDASHIGEVTSRNFRRLFSKAA